MKQRLDKSNILKSNQQKMFWLVACLALCSLCVGKSEGSSNLEKSQQIIGGSTKSTHELVNVKLHQRNTKGRGQSLERLLEVVEVKYGFIYVSFWNDIVSLMFNFGMISFSPYFILN